MLKIDISVYIIVYQSWNVNGKYTIFYKNKGRIKSIFEKLCTLCSYLLFGNTGVNKRGMNKKASKNHSIGYLPAMHIHCNRIDTGVPIKIH